MKKCSRCKFSKELQYFYKERNPRSRSGYSSQCIECHSLGHAERREKELSIKKLVFEHYGNKCVCCGEDNFGFLTIDHINDDGFLHKAECKRTPGKEYSRRLKGCYLYANLVEEGFTENLQILCFNCNIGKKNNGGICPHKKR